MDGDIVDRRDQFRVIAPHAPDFAGGHWHGYRAFDPLDVLDEIGDFHVVAVDRFVADDDAGNVAVAARQIDDRANFALIAVLVLVEPGAERDAQAEFGRDRWHQFDAAGG
jgi:hypothetical protein